MIVLSRRNFLLATASAAAAQTSATRLALLSDIHIPANPEESYRGFQPYVNLAQAIPPVIAAGPAAAIVCGDCARLQGLPGDYVNLKKLLQPAVDKFPVGLLLGNHDDRKNLMDAFGPARGGLSVKAKYVGVLETPHARLVTLDSNMRTDFTPGYLGVAQRQWLAEWLDKAGPAPVILFVHHEPWDADNSLLDTPRLMDIIRPRRNVKALLFGHSHRISFAEDAGIHLINLPALAYNFSDAEPVGWVEAVLTAKGGAFTLHALLGNKANDGQTTRLVWRS